MHVYKYLSMYMHVYSCNHMFNISHHFHRRALLAATNNLYQALVRPFLEEDNIHVYICDFQHFSKILQNSFGCTLTHAELLLIATKFVSADEKAVETFKANNLKQSSRNKNNAYTNEYTHTYNNKNDSMNISDKFRDNMMKGALNSLSNPENNGHITSWLK